MRKTWLSVSLLLSVSSLAVLAPAVHAQGVADIAGFSSAQRVFDSLEDNLGAARGITNTSASTAADAGTLLHPARSFFGEAFSVEFPGQPPAQPSGAGVEFTALQFSVRNLDSTAYTDIQATIGFYINSTGGTSGHTPIFSGIIGSPLTFDLATESATTFSSTSNFLAEVTFDSPIAMQINNARELDHLGIIIGLRGRTSPLSGYQTFSNLTLGVSFGNEPGTGLIDVGIPEIAEGAQRGTNNGSGYYRNRHGQDPFSGDLGADAQNGNMFGDDAGALQGAGQTFSAMALRLYGQQIAAVPEPSSLALMGFTLFGAFGIAQKRRKSKRASN